MTFAMIGTQKTKHDPEWMQPRDDAPRSPFHAMQGLPNWLLFAEIAFIAIHAWGLLGV